MKVRLLTHSFICIVVLLLARETSLLAGQSTQVGGAMHTPMKVHPQVFVGTNSGDIIGSDNRALQAAIDYVASLGGGVVELGPGEYLMRDSLHLRAHVTVQGVAQKTVLRKARSAGSPLKIDGDYGEEQFTVKNPEGFAVGDGVSIW